MGLTLVPNFKGSRTSCQSRLLRDRGDGLLGAQRVLDGVLLRQRVQVLDTQDVGRELLQRYLLEIKQGFTVTRLIVTLSSVHLNSIR